MRTITFLLSLFIILQSSTFISAQFDSTGDLQFDIHKVYKPLSIPSTELKEIKTIADLNKFYKESWIEKYISVDVSANCNNELLHESGKDDKLTEDQINLIKNADYGSDIMVSARYIPNNTLSYKEEKEFDFTFSVRPDNQAVFLEGQKNLLNQLKEKAINKIPKSLFEEYTLIAINFSVDTSGEVVDIKIFESSKDKKIDALLVNTLKGLKNWSPASYANGQKVKDDYVLTIGNMKNCNVNLLNIDIDRDQLN